MSITQTEPGLAKVIAFPGRPAPETTLAEVSVASLIVEAYLKSRSPQSTSWHRHRWAGYCQGMTTAFAIGVAGTCGEDQWLVAQAVERALKTGVTDPERIARIAKSPQDPVTA